MTKYFYAFEKLLCANSQEQIFSFLEDQCDHLGYSGYIYTPTMRGRGIEELFKDNSKIVGGAEMLKQDVFTTYPSAWVSRYQEAGHLERDPVVRLISTSNLPVFWDDITRRSGKQIVLDEARQHGLANGITVPICGINGDRALLSIATDIPPEKSSEHRTSTTGLVLLTALHIHEAIQRIKKNTSESLVPRLTSREKECLQWAAHGKTSWEISNILSVAERTVVFHMVNATKKMNATNRRQAVVRAISLRLISL